MRVKPKWHLPVSSQLALTSHRVLGVKDILRRFLGGTSRHTGHVVFQASRVLPPSRAHHRATTKLPLLGSQQVCLISPDLLFRMVDSGPCTPVGPVLHPGRVGRRVGGAASGPGLHYWRSGGASSRGPEVTGGLREPCRGAGETKWLGGWSGGACFSALTRGKSRSSVSLR